MLEFSFFLFSFKNLIRLKMGLTYTPKFCLKCIFAAKSLQSCPTLCDPIDGSPPGFPVPGILQARTLEWVAISFSNAWKGKVKVKSLSRVGLLATPWTAAHQAPLPMGFSRQEHWSGVPSPSLWIHINDVFIKFLFCCLVISLNYRKFFPYFAVVPSTASNFTCTL